MWAQGQNALTYCESLDLRSTKTIEPYRRTIMPLARISVAQDISNEHLQRISDAVHESMITTFEVPAKDRFQVLTRHAPNELVFAPEYLGIRHDGPVVFRSPAMRGAHQT
jgi:hypothetical protein